MDNYDQGVTFEDIHGNRDEEEAYLDEADKQECANKCWFSWMEFHQSTCPLYSEIDRRLQANAQAGIDIARGK